LNYVEGETLMRKIARIWMTDGSPAQVTDLRQLDTSHPSLLGMPARYKGTVDPAVYVGSATIAADQADDALLAEAEWCVLFPEGIDRYLRDPQQVTASTPVVLQGLIEGKWLNRFLYGFDVWQPASVGNNLLAEGAGIQTALGALEDGAAGEVEIAYPYERDGQPRTRTQRTTLADLRGQNVLALVREVLLVCRDTGEPIDGIDLSAVGEEAAVVNERWRFQQALEAMGGLSGSPTPEALVRLAESVVRAILAEGISAPPNAPMRIATRNAAGTLVGEGTLLWQPFRHGGDQ
jgi:hypothetical protein